MLSDRAFSWRLCLATRVDENPRFGLRPGQRHEGFVHIAIKHLPELQTHGGERRERYRFVAIGRRSRSEVAKEVSRPDAGRLRWD